MSPANNDINSVIDIDNVINSVIDQISIVTRDINSKSKFEYDLIEEDRNILTLLSLCKLALSTGDL